MKMRFYLLALLIPATFLSVACAPPEMTLTGTAYVYGVTEYGGSHDLDYTDDDAHAMAELFRDTGYDVKLRIDGGDEASNIGPASFTQLSADIEEFASGAAQGPLFVFYFAGHGMQYPVPGTTSDEPYSKDPYNEWILLHGFIPYISSYSSDEGALSDDELADELSTITDGTKLVILDSCHSGGFIGDSPFVDEVPEEEAYSYQEAPEIPSSPSAYFKYPRADERDDVTAANAIILSAAGELELSQEPHTLGHGTFTHAFLEAATNENGDLNDDGYITLMETYRYIADSWEGRPYTSGFHPHITGSAVDIVLFRSD